MRYTLQDVNSAWEAKDPALVETILQLARQSDPEPDQPIREEALTFERFLTTIRSDAFRNKPAEEQRSYRVEQIKQLEADDAEVPLSDRCKLYRILLLLWSDPSEFARNSLLEIIRYIPLQYGLWKALKHIYKAAEVRGDYPILGALSARFDSANGSFAVSPATMSYMVHRSWRYLRKLGETLPACYPDAVVHYLAAYEDNTNWQLTWVGNHILYHNTKKYNRNRFSFYSLPKNQTKNRAFVELWQRRSQPLLRLLELARAEQIRRFACSALQQDFKIELRDIDITWIVRLASLPVTSKAIDELVVWLLKNAPKLEQVEFKALGLHQAVLLLLDSSAVEARRYACDYIRVHARDSELSALIRWTDHAAPEVHNLAKDLLASRDPRKEVGLEGWGQLLETRYGHSLAETALLKHFGVKELTADWFQLRLLSQKSKAFAFASKHLLQLHPLKKLHIDYFLDIIDAVDNTNELSQTIHFALLKIKEMGPATLPQKRLQDLLLNPFTTHTLREWIDQDHVKANVVPLEYYKALVFHPDWEQSKIIQALQQSGKRWAKALVFDEHLAEQVRLWLQDVRRFTPSSLGFDWLLQLVTREEKYYHKFAVDIMVKAFLPADFSPTSPQQKNQTSKKDQKTIDLAGQSFLFIGTLNTMTRKEAQSKVTTANGKNSSTVSKKLDYLVIGDEGSPLYGPGRKESKQLQGERLIKNGATLKIISETAFLQMLAGKQQLFSKDRTEQGCETLWRMATDKVNQDQPIARFALRYLRYHHPDICLQETDRPVAPEASIPVEFLCFDRFRPLLQENYLPLRKYALEMARWEFARWSPNVNDLIFLCESRHQDVRDFVRQALLAKDSPKHTRYRIDASQLTTDTVYSFCESKEEKTRALGMELIVQTPKFQSPKELFRLTESPDPRLRAFVVKRLWSLYQHRATTTNWRPQPVAHLSMGKKNQQQAAQVKINLGTGAPKRPKSLPAHGDVLEKWLQRWLYEIPPGRVGKHKLKATLQPLSASLAKKALIETLRDLALEDAAFATLLLPLLETFMLSRGKMEQAACLVAVTRIRQAHPQWANKAAA